MTVRIETREGELVYDILTRGPDGAAIRERRYSPVTGKSATKRWAQAREQHLATHGRTVGAAPLPTLREWSAEWLAACAANKLKPSTLAAYGTRLRLHVLPALGSELVDAIGDAAAGKLKAAMAKLDAKTINDALGALSGMLNLAERRRIIVRAPRMEKLRKDASEGLRFYDFQEWERLVAGAVAAGPMVYAAVLLAGEAGLRRGELVALEQADCGADTISIRWSEWNGLVGSPKGNRIRRVPMTERLRLAIAKVRHLRGKRLLWQSSGKKVGVPTLQSWLETACRRAGLPESRDIHKLRHTFCSHLAMRGATPRGIQELAGHSEIKTTMRYMHLSPAHLDETIKLLENRPAGGAGMERKS